MTFNYILLIFNDDVYEIYTECSKIFENTYDEVINNLRYADDTVIIASSPNELQRMIHKIVVQNKRSGLYMKISKTKTIVFSKILKKNKP